MIEYPSIISSSKSPKTNMIAFEKIDGSNIRVKWTAKRGFNLFGSRTQLIDETHPHLGGVINVFNKDFAEPLHQYFSEEFKRSTKVDEVIVFGEYYGPNSFAGMHYDPVEEMIFTAFDVMLIGKVRSFLLPQEFIKTISPLVPTAKVVYEGNLTEQFINDVRNNQLDVELNEGVVCKGTQRSGAYRGGVWMCKIKTLRYFEKLKDRFGEGWKKFGE